ncbi:hypothetical protein [Pseudomonas sp. G(2018)]|uniref:hypothetical protein n=1 Tax=Pseudomonas sp. G(2018) TaxID=2502242 RepID=UPI0010F9EE4C|nr:hypothetical protein [Pseudomonas sp. G(2018)]
MPTTHVDLVVGHLRAKALVWRLCDLAGCQRKPYALWRWWHLHQEEQKDDRRKWDAYFKGVTPRPSLREEMYTHFPSLRALFDNPLWLALSADPEHRQDWDQLAARVRVGDQPLGGLKSSASLLLFSRVDWPCLGLMIILLRTQSNRFLLHRKWLQLNFYHFFYIACLQAPLLDFQLELYDLLTELLARDVDLHTVIVWPDSVEEFEYQLGMYYFMLDGIRTLNWLGNVEAQHALLLWTLMEVDSELITSIAFIPENCPIKWPLKLRRIWIRRSKLWQAMPITVDHYVVPDPFC